MKTNRISMALLLGILLTLLPFTIWAAPVGKITTLEGQADVTVRGVTSPCKIGLEVNEGDIIRTKKQSRVGVTLLDGNVIWVAPLSRLRITQYHPGEGKQNYCDLFRGKTRVVVNAIAKGASLEVHTPTAVAGVRGTIFIGFFERGESGFVFERGSGYGYNRQMPAKVVTIEAGHVMLVPKADQEPIVRPATKQEIERHMKDTTGGEEKPKEKKADQEKPTEAAEAEKKEAEAAKAGEPQKKTEPTPSSETPVVATPEPTPVVTQVSTTLQTTGDVTKKVEEVVQRRVETTTTVTTTPTNDLVPISVDLGGVAGSLSGSIDDKTGEGTIKFTTTSTTPDFAGYVKGSFKDGSVLDAYLGGITGSWQGLFYGLTKKGDSVSLLTAGLDDKGYSGSGSLSASGRVVRTLIGLYSSDLGEKSLYLPYFNEVSPQRLGVGMATSTLLSYTNTTGQVYGIWGSEVEGGYYGGGGTPASWTGHFAGIEEIGDAGTSVALGVARVTDDGVGHVQISSDKLYYMDGKYFGEGSLSHRGVYDGEDYVGVTAGNLKLTPLSYSGYVGGWLVTNSESPVGEIQGVFGGTTNLPWSGNADLKVMGMYYVEPALADKKSVLFGVLSGQESSNAYFVGNMLGLWNSSLKGAFRGIYFANGVGGFIASDDLAFTSYLVGTSEFSYGGWMAEGTLSARSMPIPTNFKFVGFFEPNLYMSLAGTAQPILGQGLFMAQFPRGQDWTPLNWGIYGAITNGMGLEAGVTDWEVAIGGIHEDYQFAMLGTATGKQQSGEIKGQVSGDFVTPTMMGTFTGPVYGASYGNGDWTAASIGTLEGKYSLHGGEWLHSTIYNDGGTWSWNSIGEDTEAYFGMTRRTDGKLDFLAIGGYRDYGYGANGYGGPYILSGALYGYQGALLEGFTGGLMKKAGENDVTGSIEGYLASLFAGYGSGKWQVGLVRGELNGTFYEMFAGDVYEEALYDMFRLKSKTAGLEVKDKSTLLPSGLGENDVSIDYGDFSSLRLAGSFNGTGMIVGDFYRGKTKFLVYDANGNAGSLPFGIYNLKIGDGNSFYQGKPSGSETSFLAKIGGEADFGSQDTGYWLGSVSGNSWQEYATGAGHGTITGALSGRYLTPTQMGSITGPFYGLYQGTSEGSWIGLSVGTYEGAPLSMSASLSGNLAAVVPGSLRIRNFLSPQYRQEGSRSIFDPLQYETIYFVPKNGATDIGRTLSYEWREMPAGGDPYYEKIVLYYPAGRWMALQRGLGITRIIEGGQTAQNWSLSGNFPSAWISQGMAFYANPNPGISTFTYGQFVPGSDVSRGDVNGIMMGEKIDGLLGVLPGQSLWTSGAQSKASMIMMGTHGAYAGHQIFYSSIASVYGTGTFFADMLGIIRDTGGASGNPMDGLLIGLYADGQGKVGALKGEWTGYSYPKIGMWETAVSDTAAYIYRDGTLKDIAGGAVNAGNLTDHLISSGIGLGTNGTFYGTFGGSGYISTPIGVTGRTYFLDDQPDWGIFRLNVGAMNNYEKPSGTGTSFSATLFGDGSFGRYKASSYHDLGMWYANLSSGTWENEKLAGAFTGEFVTLLKKGTMEGKLLGTYDGKGSWQAVGAGTWAKAQDVYFGSEIWGKNYTLTRQKYGWVVTSSYSYNFSFHDRGFYRYGSGVLVDGIATVPPAKYTYYWYGMEDPWRAPQRHIWTHTTADDKFTYKIEYFEDLASYYAALETLAKDPKTGNSITTSESSEFLTSDFSGVFAGLDNLWANIGVKGTPVYLLGDTNIMDVKGAFDLFHGEVMSVDPLISLDPISNSKSRVWDGKYGAYYGFLGGRNNAAQSNGLEVMFKAFYLDQGGNYGLLYTDPSSPITGFVNENVGMWKAEGNIYGYVLGTGGIPNVSVENFAGSLGRYDYSSVLNETGQNIVGPEGSGIILNLAQGTYLNLPAATTSPIYSIGFQASAGTYTGALPSAWTWSWERGGMQPVEQTWILANVTAKDKTFNGSITEVKGDWINAAIYVRGGDIKGVFDPNAYTWKAVSTIFQIDAAKLAEKVNSFTTDAQREAFQKATRIPAFEIGRTDLKGAYSLEPLLIIDMSSGNYGMRDVVFLAPSTGARPQVWTTGSVSGRTLGTSVPPGTTVPLSNAAGTVTANFTFKAYMPCEGKWSASVSGNAPSGIGSYGSAFTFQGGAAGKIQGTVGSGDFTFSGAAAGIVPPK